MTLTPSRRGSALCALIVVGVLMVISLLWPKTEPYSDDTYEWGNLVLRPVLMPYIPARSVLAALDDPAMVPVMDKLAQCESSWRWNVVGDGGRAYGVLQFHRPTFEEFKTKYGLDNFQYEHPEDQMVLAERMIANGYGYLWTCWKKINR